MMQEKIQEVIQDLKPRLIYGVKCRYHKYGKVDETITPTLEMLERWPYQSFMLHPFLRPLTHIKHNEIVELFHLEDASNLFWVVVENDRYYLEYVLNGRKHEDVYLFSRLCDDKNNEKFFLKHHFDHHRLIENSCAYQAPDEMYGEKLLKNAICKVQENALDKNGGFQTSYDEGYYNGLQELIKMLGI